VSRDDTGLGRRLRELRTARRLSQRDVAKLAGVTAGAVNRWELGIHKSIRPRTLFALADAFGVDARWLALGETTPAAATASASRLIAALNRLTGRQAELMAKALEELAPVASPVPGDGLASLEPAKRHLVEEMISALKPGH